MIRYHELPQHETVTILALNMDNEDWVFACPAIYVRGQSRIWFGFTLIHYAGNER